MLKHSDYSNKLLALQFFKYCLHFTVIHKIFDNCDGLLEIINMVRFI